MILISLCYLLSIKRSYDPIQFQATSVLFTILPSIPYLVGLHFNHRQTKNMQQHEKISDYLEEWLWINWQFQLVSIKSKNTYCNTHHNLVCSAVADLNSTGWTVIRGTFHIIFVFSLSILYIVSNIVDLNSSADYHYSLIIIIQHKIIKLKTSIKQHGWCIIWRASWCCSSQLIHNRPGYHLCLCMYFCAWCLQVWIVNLFIVNFPGSRLSSHHMLLHILCLPLVQVQSNQLWSWWKDCERERHRNWIWSIHFSSCQILLPLTSFLLL